MVYQKHQLKKTMKQHFEDENIYTSILKWEACAKHRTKRQKLNDQLDQQKEMIAKLRNQLDNHICAKDIDSLRDENVELKMQVQKL